jgi:short-subunit dehydrogenase
LLKLNKQLFNKEKIMSKFDNKKYGPWALVTGASSGIGKAISTQLASKGINIVAVARSESNLQTLKTELEVKYDVKVKVIAEDLLKSETYQLINEQTKDLDIGLLIANAGVENNGLFSDNDIKNEEQLIAINVTGPMKLSHEFSQRFAKRGGGGIVLVSSLFGYQGIPLVANYSATKAYILTLGEALNVELKPKGIDVTVLSPGLTKTPMSQNMAINFNKMPITSHSPEYVAQIALSALGRKATVVPGLINKIYAWENRFIPRSWPVKLFGFLIKRAQIKNSENPQTSQQIQAK